LKTYHTVHGNYRQQWQQCVACKVFQRYFNYYLRPFFFTLLCYIVCFSLRVVQLWLVNTTGGRPTEREVGETWRKKMTREMRKGQSERENTFYCHLSAPVREKVFFPKRARERNTYKYMASSRGGRVEKGEIRLPE